MRFLSTRIFSFVLVVGTVQAQDLRESRAQWLKVYFQSNQGKLLLEKSSAMRNFIGAMAEGCGAILQQAPIEAFLATVASPTSKVFVVDSSSEELILRLKILKLYLRLLEDGERDPWSGEGAAQYNRGVEAPLLRVVEFFLKDFQAISREFLFSVSQKDQSDRFLEIIDKVLKDPHYEPGDMELGLGVRTLLKRDRFPAVEDFDALKPPSGSAYELREEILGDQKFFLENLRQVEDFSTEDIYRNYFDFSIVSFYYSLDRLLTKSSRDLSEDPIYFATICTYLIYLTNYMENFLIVSGQKELKGEVYRFVSEDLRILLAVALEVSIHASLPSLLNRFGASLEIQQRFLAALNALEAET